MFASMEQRPGKRDRKRQLMEQVILDEATELMRADGPAGLTIGALARRLDLSVGGLYRYYPSKGAIMVGLERRSIATFQEVQQDLLAAIEPQLYRRSPRV